MRIQQNIKLKYLKISLKKTKMEKKFNQSKKPFSFKPFTPKKINKVDFNKKDNIFENLESNDTFKVKHIKVQKILMLFLVKQGYCLSSKQDSEIF